MTLTAAKEKGYSKQIIYSDDGISGVTMNRPGFKQMISDIENGYISAIFIKDMSRLGRNYLQVGHYTEEFFPEHDIRLVAVTDGVDTDDGIDEFTPFRNIMNEWYARDISKKVRAVHALKSSAGYPLNSYPPYGYMKDPSDERRWVVDEEAARVVRRIFQLTLDGYGSEQIATTLDKDGILTPTNYWQSKGCNRGGVKTAATPTAWNSSTIVKMLTMGEYCGDVINFKTYSKSFKQKKRIKNTTENMAIFKDAHEPVVDRVTFEKVQQKRVKGRKRVNHSGEKNKFSGLLICADCGRTLNFHFNQGNHSIEYFNCPNNNKARKTCDKTHYIRVDFLEQVVLQEIRRLTKFASHYEHQFAELVMGHTKQESEIEQKLKRKELDKCIARDGELDKLFQYIYEDNRAGKISDDRFSKLQRQYEAEQGEINVKIKALREELEKETNTYITSDMFISSVRKYTRAKKLSERMLNELIERIEVHHAEIVDGVKTQRLVIHYNCIGTVEIPDVLPLPIPQVCIDTRKGVSVNYTS